MARSVLPMPSGSDPEWQTELLDLDAYLARVGYDGPRTPTLETLRALHRAHADAISWEIVDSAVGRRISLDIESVQDKIVRRGQGGCCLESNLLFAAALDRLGFPLVRHLARVRRGSRAVRTRSHVVLLVEVDGDIWFADPGFGDESPLEPLPFRHDGSVTVGEWTWRLQQDGEEWLLQSLHADGWFDVYAWWLEPQHFIDFDMVNHFSYADPRSVFMPPGGLSHLIAQRGDEKTRLVLKNTVLTTQYPDGRVEHAELTPDEVVETLQDAFRITLRPEDAEFLRKRFVEEPAEQPAQ
ncbi:putative arylamine n-acetyl transferase [Streptomyces echinoruber]|uniref:Arylamine n-acetyl transferase n=2 Tax=Streptomyces echinoruber TaxID=68898 RepID=A0A918VGS6_9ACTN|nr:putative arylamine n-acetyl transferase [Streptomyces echinoruber]